MKIIGQEKLLAKLDTYSPMTLPKSMFFCGETGCGKHYFAKFISQKFNLDLQVIQESVTHEQLVEFSQKAIPTLYVIELDKFNEKQQNQFLKFIEEPAQSVYILLIANSEIGILPTILNRCIKYYFEPYTPEQLKEISGMSEPINNKIYKVCNTPGKLLQESTESFRQAYELCNTIVYGINGASWANTIKISTKINYKEEYNKINFNLFFDTLEYVAFRCYKIENIPLSFNIYMLVKQAKEDMLNKPIIKENFMLNFLTKLWKGTR